MKPPSRNKLLLVGPVALAVALAAGGAYMVARAPLGGGLLGSHGVLDAVPASSYLVATLDVAALRASPLGPEPLRGGRSDVPSVDRLSDACGFPVLARLKELALAIPEGGDPGDFGIVATVDATPRELATCAEKAEPSHGQKTKITTRGPFTILETEGAPATAPKVVYREGGPLLLGQDPWLGEMMETLEGKKPSLATRAEHARLRASVTPAPPRKPTLVVSAVLPKALRDRLRAELAQDDLGKDSPMGGILGVAEVALAVVVGPSGQSTDVSAHMSCEDEGSCASVKTLLERKRFEASQDIGARIMGLGPVIEGFSVEAKGKALDARTSAPSDDLAKLVDRFMRLRRPPSPSGLEPPGAGAPPRPLFAPPPSTSRPGSVPGSIPGSVSAPDETVRPPRSSKDLPDGAASSAPRKDP